MDKGLYGWVYRARPGGWPAILNDDPEVCQQLISPRAVRKRHASHNLLPLKALHSNGTSQHLYTLSLTSCYARRHVGGKKRKEKKQQQPMIISHLVIGIRYF